MPDDRYEAIKWSTAAAVIGVAAVAAVVSHEHGETGWTAHLVPLTGDGLIWASSMVMLDSARRGARVPALARWLLGLGIAASLRRTSLTAWAMARSVLRLPHGRRWRSWVHTSC